jgi:hypothetical protein
MIAWWPGVHYRVTGGSGPQPTEKELRSERRMELAMIVFIGLADVALLIAIVLMAVLL